MSCLSIRYFLSTMAKPTLSSILSKGVISRENIILGFYPAFFTASANLLYHSHLFKFTKFHFGNLCFFCFGSMLNIITAPLCSGGRQTVFILVELNTLGMRVIPLSPNWQIWLSHHCFEYTLFPAMLALFSLHPDLSGNSKNCWTSTLKLQNAKPLLAIHAERAHRSR